MKKLVEVSKNICKYGVELVVATIAALLLLVSVVFGSLGCVLKAFGQLLDSDAWPWPNGRNHCRYSNPWRSRHP